jgi:hypothetical protein
MGFLQTNKRVQFELFPTHQLLEIRINSRLIELSDEEFAVLILIYEDEDVKIKRKVNGAFKISFTGSPFRFRVHIRPTFDFFDLETLLERDKFSKLSTPSYGLLGDLNDLMFPNGTRIPMNPTDQNILFQYGESWHVSTNNSIFYYLFDDITHHRSSLSNNRLNTFKQTLNEHNCNDDTSQQDQEHCIQSVSADETELLGENDMHHPDQHHWESLADTRLCTT